MNRLLLFSILTFLFSFKNNYEEVNIPYSNISSNQILSIKYPANIDKRNAAILIIQGSDTTNIKINSLIEQAAINKGFAVVSINYRDEKKYPFPASIQDVNSAIRWVKKFGHKYNLSPDKLFLFGASEQGYLATLAGVTSTYIEGVTAIIEFGNNAQIMQAQENEQKNQNYVELFCSNQLDRNTKVLGVIDFYGYLDKNIKYYSPITYITPLSPPIIMVYGAQDKNIPLERVSSFYKKLKENICPNGVKECYTKLLIIEKGEHGGTAFYSELLIEKVFNYVEDILKNK